MLETQQITVTALGARIRTGSSLVLTPNKRLAAYLQEQVQKQSQQVNNFIRSSDQQNTIVWSQQAILPYTTWFQQLWEQVLTVSQYLGQKLGSGQSLGAGQKLDAGRLLSPSQQLIIWQQIIQNSKRGDYLLRLTATAQQAQDAWRLLLESGHDLQSLQAQIYYLSEDCLAFNNWAEQYVQKIADLGQIDLVLALKYLVDWLESTTIVDNIINLLQLNFINELYLVEFLDLPPLWQRLFELLSTINNFKLVRLELITEPIVAQVTAPIVAQVTESSEDQLVAATAQPASVLLAWPNIEVELEAAIIWAKNHLSSGRSEQNADGSSSVIKNSNGNIGILVPDLGLHRDLLCRLLQEHLTPDQYNVSAPLPIVNYPAVKILFLVFKLVFDQLSFQEYAVLIKSAFIIGSQAEYHQRHRIELISRQHLECYVRLPDLVAFLDKLPELGVQAEPRLQVKMGVQAESSVQTEAELHPVPKLQHMCRQLFHLVTEPKLGRHFSDLKTMKNSCEQWVQVINQIVQIIGWPGSRQLTQFEIDLTAGWQSLLQQYLALDQIIQEHDWSYAQTLLIILAQLLPFAPQTEAAPIQFLGLLEGTGLVFEQLWITGMARETWPPAPDPNPFLPILWQQELKLPRSSPERELQVAEQITKIWQRTTKQQLVFSYPTLLENINASPSQLVIEQLKLGAAPAPAFTDLVTSLKAQIITSLEADKAQKQLPLARLLPVVETAIPAEWLQHNQDFYQQFTSKGLELLKLQAICPFRAFVSLRFGLKELPEPSYHIQPRLRGSLVHAVMQDLWQVVKTQRDLRRLADLNSLVLQFIQKRLNILQQQYPQLCTADFQQLEQKRLLQIVKLAVAEDKQRADFQTWALETKVVLKLAGYSFNLRLDRIDLLANNKLFIIDYKTGTTNLNELFSERIAEPQLAAYALSQNYEQLAGLAIMHLSPEQASLKAVTEEHEHWWHLARHWEEALSLLLTEFQAGRAEVQPKADKYCRWCPLTAVCRIAAGR